MQRLLEHIRMESRVAVWWWGPTAVSILFRRELEDLVVCTATVKEWERATKSMGAGSVIHPQYGLGCWYSIKLDGVTRSVFMKCPDLTTLPFYKFVLGYGLTATPRSARWWLQHK